jgi:lysyl-tRNA synthetase class 2
MVEPGKEAEKAAEQEVAGGEKKLYKDDVTGEMVSKNELKLRQKLRKKEEDKKKKDEEKKKKEEEKKAAGGSKKNEVELDPTQYTENRKHYIESLRA